MAGFFRVDKFLVPAEGRGEFLERVAQTHTLLRTQDGFVRDYILERESAPGVFDVVTFVEWADASVLERVKAAVARRHAELGFDREELVHRLGIRAEIGSYGEVEPRGSGPA